MEDQLAARCVEYETTIAAQAATIARLEARIAEQDARISELEALVADLQTRLKQDSSNSSKPPSSNSPYKKPPYPKKPKSGKRSGGQPGHRAHMRAAVPSDAVDIVEDHYPEQCRRCGNALSAADDVDQTRGHQVTELPPVKVVVTEHRLHACACTACGTITKAVLPADVPQSAFGPNLQAEVAHLTANCRLSRRGLITYAAESWGTSISMGSVYRIEQNVSQALAQPYTQALETVKAAPVRHVDETHWKQSGVLGWLWSMGCVLATVFVIAGTRAGHVFTDTMGDAVENGIFVTDRYRGYLKKVPMNRRGVCHAHLRRDFAKIEARGGYCGMLGEALRCAHTRMFDVWYRYRDGEITHDTLGRELGPIKWRMYRLLKNGRSAADKKVAGMCADILRHWPAMWTFARVPGVEPTNNAAERSLRPAVLWRKGCFGSRSTGGAVFAERMLTVSQTCRQNGRNVLEYIVTALNASLLGLPAPQLIPQHSAISQSPAA